MLGLSQDTVGIAADRDTQDIRSSLWEEADPEPVCRLRIQQP
jgi:hypothetical protein